MDGIRAFTLFDVPVYFRPSYLLILVLFAYGGDLVDGLLFAGVITVSILIHEFGHALVAKRYRLRPEVTLHAMGGYTTHQRASWDREEALILAAGPGAGLVLGVISAVVWIFGASTASDLVRTTVWYSMWVNIVWTGFNLLPIWPLDGGQLTRLFLLRVLKPSTAERAVHGVALALIAGLLAYTALSGAGTFFAILLLLLGWQNLQAMRAGGTPMARRGDSDVVRSLLSEAQRALSSGDTAGAVRISHQLKSANVMSPGTTGQMFAVLGVATTRLGQFDEALSYLKRANSQPDVTEAFAQCYFQLELWDELDDLLRSRPFKKLPPATQDIIRGSYEHARK
ncbi:MAG: site-2 protease family protein [Polyangiales bacterium]|nr:site-2 protease family protein [Myxococcales bacterium]